MLASSCWRLRILDASPETTHCVLLLTAANESAESSRGATSTCESGTASIDPGGMACINLPLMVTAFRASWIDKTPAIQAAVYSPRLCPIIAWGVIPQEAMSWTRLYCTATKTGWAILVSLIDLSTGDSATPAG